MKNFFLSVLAAVVATAVSAPAQAQTNEEPDWMSQIITEAPEGRTVYYSLSGNGYNRTTSGPKAATFNNEMGEVVFCDDGTVYFRNPIVLYDTDSYVKGTLDDGVVTLQLHQPVIPMYTSPEPSCGYAERLVRKDGADGPEYVVDEDNPEIKFVLRNDSLIWAEPTDGSVILGIADERGEWFGCGNYATTYALPADKVVETPAGMAVEDWSMTYDGNSRLVKMGFSGSDVYIGGLWPSMPDAWVKGTVEGGKAVFAGGQYLGPDTTYECHAYFMTAEPGMVWSEDWGEYVEGLVMTDRIELTYDAEARTMTADAQDGSSMVISRGKDSIRAIGEYASPVFKAFVLPEGAVTPKTPEVAFCLPFDGDPDGKTFIEVMIPKFDVDDNLLDTAKLSYTIFVDDEPYTFTTDVYTQLSADMTDIPYSFTDMTDIFNYDTYKDINLYVKDFRKVGVRSTYTAANGETAHSDIAWYYVDDEPTGIGSAAAAGKSVVSVTYTDLSGRVTAKPARGLYVKTVVYGDGTREGTKVLVR